jgi:hypothetical protein
MPEKIIDKQTKVTTNTDGLNSLIQASQEAYVVRVGILGSSAAAQHQRRQTGELKKNGGHKIGENPSDMTNADIGLVHEKGVKSLNIPRRSWLKTPLEDNLPEYFEKIGPEALELIITQQNVKNYETLGVVAEQIIQKGFETGGYGKWAPLKPMTIALKNSSAILIDTGQLRKSITHEVVAA